MQIFSINEDGLDLFCGLTDQTNHDPVSNARTMMLDLWRKNESRPEWCFLAQENGEILGRVGYRHHGSLDEIWPIELELPWRTDYLAVGKALLGESLTAMAALGTRRVLCQVSSHWPTANVQRQLYAAAGFTLRQAKSAFRLTMPAPPMSVSDRLVYRTLAEVGEAKFIEAIQRASVQTLDRDDQMTIDRVGLQQIGGGLLCFVAK